MLAKRFVGKDIPRLDVWIARAKTIKLFRRAGRLSRRVPGGEGTGLLGEAKRSIRRNGEIQDIGQIRYLQAQMNRELDDFEKMLNLSM